MEGFVRGEWQVAAWVGGSYHRAMLTILLSLLAIISAIEGVRRDEWSTSRRALAGAFSIACVVGAAAMLPNILYLQKVIGRLAMPTGILWLLLGAMAVRSWYRGSRLDAALATFAFVAYTAAGAPATGDRLLASLEADYVPLVPLSGEKLDAVLVMGGSTGVGPDGGTQLATSGDRLRLAAMVHKAGRTDTLVVSGSTIAGLGPPRDLATEAAEILEMMGVPAGAIVKLREPKNSSQELRAFGRLADERGWHAVGLLTSAWHLRRSTRLAAAEGLVVEPLPADFRGSRGWDGVLSVVPDGDGFRKTSAAFWEYLGAAVGR